MITVFYDGKCGLCAKEIAYYQRIAPLGIFDWQDITRSTDALTRENISLVDGLRWLHAKDDAGKMHIGVDAFIVIWQELRYWRILGLLVNLPVIRTLANYAYRLFANWRFKRLAHCQLAQKQAPKT